MDSTKPGCSFWYNVQRSAVAAPTSRIASKPSSKVGYIYIIMRFIVVITIPGRFYNILPQPSSVDYAYEYCWHDKCLLVDWWVFLTYSDTTFTSWHRYNYRRWRCTDTFSRYTPHYAATMDVKSLTLEKLITMSQTLVYCFGNQIHLI